MAASSAFASGTTLDKGVVLAACAFAAQHRTAQTQAKSTQIRKKILANGAMPLPLNEALSFDAANRFHVSGPIKQIGFQSPGGKAEIPIGAARRMGMCLSTRFGIEDKSVGKGQ